MSVVGNTALRFDEDYALLLDSARAFCGKAGGSVAARQYLESEQGHAPDTWTAMVDMGWTGVGLPESVGGSGLEFGAAVPLLESMGRALLGTPLMSSLLASQLLLRAGCSEALLSRLASGARATVATVENGDWSGPDSTRVGEGCLSGGKQLVADAASADIFVVSALRDGEAVLAVVDRSALPADAVQPRTLIDLTHRAADVSFADVPVDALLEGGQVRSALKDYQLLGALLVAAESTGAAAACLDTLVDYLQTRKQFGKVIGSYQALKHPAVDLLCALDSSRSFIYHAATVLDDQPLAKDGEIACRMAKAQATDTLKSAGDRAVQFHGAMGFTWDCDAQLYLRRAQWAQQQFGDAQYHRQCLAQLLLD